MNNVLEAHLGTTIDELRVICDLDVSHEFDIDKWLAFAFAKHVKRVELDLSHFTELTNRTIPLINDWDCYTWPLQSRLKLKSHNLVSLTSLSLKYVSVTVKDIECALHSCPALENLCIFGGSNSLTYIKLPHLSLKLKHLEVSCCPRLLSIDIRPPKLVSLALHGRRILEIHRFMK